MPPPDCRALVFCCLLFLFPAFRAPAGSVSVSVQGQRITVIAEDAPLREVLGEIDAALPADIRFRTIPDRTVTGTWRDQPLDRLLRQLGVDYTLFYRPVPGQADPVLERASIRLDSIAEFSPSERAEIRRLISALADDAVRFNALDGWRRLRRLGGEAMPALERATRSPDYQTRQFAADLLAALGDDFTPTSGFAEILVEGLQDDAYPYGRDSAGRKRYTGLNNARRGYDVLTRRDAVLRLAEPALERALYSQDPQQRFLSALILAQGGRTQHANRLATILTPHLADNRIQSDGGLAAYSLARLGPAVAPALYPLLRAEDDQARQLATQVLRSVVPGIVLPDPPVAIRGNPVESRPGLYFDGWEPDHFPPVP